jgi:SecD/SecF fusion protein
MQSMFFWLWIAFAIVAILGLAYGQTRRVSGLYWRGLFSILPALLAGIVAGQALVSYNNGQGGFKLGIDLVGGTILVYEVDQERKPENYKAEQLASALKRRIDPADLYNVTIRPVAGGERFEIILPSGGAHQANIAERNWKDLLGKVQSQYAAKLHGAELDVPRGLVRDLALQVQQKSEAGEWSKLLTALPDRFPKLKDVKDLKLDAIAPGKIAELVEKVKTQAGANDADVKKVVDELYQPTKFEDVEQFLKKEYASGKDKQDITGEEVQRIKEKIKQVGSMEFRILANNRDDRAVFDATLKYFNDLATNAKLKEEVDRRALLGLPPPLPAPAEGERDFPTTRDELGRFTYEWVEVGRNERPSLFLNNAAENDTRPLSASTNRTRRDYWLEVATARDKGAAMVFQDGQFLIYSRKCVSRQLSDEERSKKGYEYFLLTRVPEEDEAADPDPVTGRRPRMEIVGKDLIDAREDFDRTPQVSFTFNNRGGTRFYHVTSRNRPDPNETFFRHLAIILDGQIMSAPRLNEPIRERGRILGNFTPAEVERLVGILRAGALPATLKPLPVSENTMGATLGADTIRNGTRAVGLAFFAVLIFMCIYYRFAGLVASVALLFNLLLTVAFMVFVNATFTLPGLAGLVLMLGMAVDANVLIYERLREERDKGANLFVAIRNGYDRALPAIIDTHLTSIFTAIVLYVVGNDQLKGFGVSLAAGLIISLYTSLFVTRTIFNAWIRMEWLTKLSMFRFFSRPNINFMRIRYYWFTATIILTIFGVTVFLLRGERGLNIDFVGGTAYGGRLAPGQARTVGELRTLLDNQNAQLQVREAKQLGDDPRSYRIVFADGESRDVVLANTPPGQSPSDRETNVKERAGVLPDWSVEQVFLSADPHLNADEERAGKSRYFTVRTTEKEPEIVLASIDRLMRSGGQSLLQKVKMETPVINGRRVELNFSDYASPAYVKMLLERQLATLAGGGAFVEITGEDRGQEGRHQKMMADLGSPAFAGLKDADIKSLVSRLQEEFNARPLSERLENFDAQLAAETQTKAMYAILASWAAILLYLWFRFGSWTFGAAAVICLIHDLFFTLGIIAFCHFAVKWMPGLAGMLLIEDFKIDLPAVAALLTLVGYSVNDTIVVFDRIREVRGKNPLLTAQMINDSVNQTLSRTLLASLTTWLVVFVLYLIGGDGVHLFAFVMVIGVIVGTYSSIYIASPLLLIFGEGNPPATSRTPRTEEPAAV